MAKVLYIDDNADDREMACFSFQKSKIKIKSISTTEEAFKELRKEAYDIVISDMIMPGHDGLDFAKKLSFSDIDVSLLFTSSIEALEDFKNYTGLRNYLGFILKPITPEKVKPFLKEAV